MNFECRIVSKELPYFILQILNDYGNIITSYIVSTTNYTFFTIPDRKETLSLLNQLVNDKYIEILENTKNDTGDTYTCKLTPKLIIAII